MKLEVKYLFPTSSSGANFYIYQLYEGLGMIAHGIRTQNNPQTKVDFFWIFMDFHRFMRVQKPTCTSSQKFHQWCR